MLIFFLLMVQPGLPQNTMYSNAFSGLGGSFAVSSGDNNIFALALASVKETDNNKRINSLGINFTRVINRYRYTKMLLFPLIHRWDFLQPRTI